MATLFYRRMTTPASVWQRIDNLDAQAANDMSDAMEANEYETRRVVGNHADCWAVMSLSIMFELPMTDSGFEADDLHEDGFIEGGFLSGASKTVDQVVALIEKIPGVSLQEIEGINTFEHEDYNEAG